MFSQPYLRLSILLISILVLIVHAEEISLQELVAGVDPQAIHAALHESIDGKYKHGVFEGDRGALEAVHRSSPTEATRIIQLAKQKRQSNLTVTTSEGNIHTSTTILSTRTVTLSDGQRSTITEITVIVPTNPAEPVGSPEATTTPATSTKTGTPALQTNEAGRMAVSGAQQMMLAALAVVGGMAAAL